MIRTTLYYRLHWGYILC